MAHCVVVLGAVCLPCVASAQVARDDTARTARSHVTMSVGATRARGRGFTGLDGYTAQIALSREVKRSGRISWRVGASGGSVFNNGYDPVCVPRSDGTCAPSLPSIDFGSALAGVEVSGSVASAALSAGPALYGAGTTQISAGGLGAEARVDATLRVTRAVGLTVQGRFLGLPKFDQGTVTVRSVAVGIRASW